MRILGISLLAAFLCLGSTEASAAKKKGKAKAPAIEPDNPAKPEEINKLKGEFKWSMSPEEVMAVVKKDVEAKYTDRLKKAGADPAKQDRIRKEMRDEVNDVKKSFTKFEGNKTGWDVSVIDQEFGQNSSEAMLRTREDQWTRYFFFFDNKLYKMYMALDKDYLERTLKGKGFKEFGEMMQAKYGTARLVNRTENKKQVPDYYIWSSMTSDSLKLIDRSGFYGVYCLVVYDGNEQDRVIERRKVSAPVVDDKDSLVEAVTAKGDNTRDANDNIIDRLTGREIRKPGEEEKAQDIVVPSVRAPTAKEVNQGAAASEDKGGKKDKKKEKAEGLEGGLEL